MDFRIAIHTDVGIRKKINQDSALVKVAETSLGRVAFAVICDGMGGLPKGELASATMIRRLSTWFDKEFPLLLKDAGSEAEYGSFSGGRFQNNLERSLRDVIREGNAALKSYGHEKDTSLGTTLVSILMIGHDYFLANVGDSRVYQVTQNVYQLTKDQTIVQREVDAGRLTPEEAENDVRRSVLLQCIGASGDVEPVFESGRIPESGGFLLCSDGFRHRITVQEILEYLGSGQPADEREMKEGLVFLTELCKKRNEHDNITAVMIRVI